MKKNYKTIWHKNKYIFCKKDKLDRQVKGVLNYCIKYKKETKKFKIYFNFTLKELFIHLQLLFDKNMNFENYGKWHIDHIVSKNKFIYHTIDNIEYKKCWDLYNLQPLWAKDNLKKGTK